ncbi:RNA polymerase sigma factor [Leucothrix arctica]|uniref:RNA polymerase subunit sigma-24 n=1 Tax=Leucothrix arctica TaxID=1481894 RepID=A0A317CGM2_9GAMM|nr:RNA polymerase sigma factor [Leucothrix arctica]PWQ97537.1 RNA polymerase subunit sigma-24 [Leucothrix arctica]
MLDKKQLNQLYRFAISLTHQDDQAYDLLQSCVEKYLKQKHREIANPMAYMKQTIRNEFIDQTRKQRFQFELRPEVIESIDYEQSQQETSLEDLHIQQEEVESLLCTLLPDERELLYLWAVVEYTIDEIAILKQVPRGTLSSKLHRLKKRIQLQQSSDNVLHLKVKS